MIKNKTLKEVHNYFIEILGFDEKSSEIKSNLQKNKEYDELDRFFKCPPSHLGTWICEGEGHGSEAAVSGKLV
jgi:hypothetical protein